MSDPYDPGPPGPGGDERWAKWEQWRAGDLHLRDPDQLIGEQGLGEPGAPTTVPWRAREALYVFMLHLLLAAVLAVFATVAVADQDTLTAVAILIFECSLLGTTLLWVRVRHRVGARALGFRGFTTRNVLVGLGVGGLGLLLATLVGGLLQELIERVTGRPAPQPDQIPLVGEPEGALLWIVGFSVVLLAPVAEETFFRGLLFGGLRRWAKAWPSILVSAVLFALVHVDPIVILPILFLGVVLSWIVERRRSLVPAIVAHLAFNLFGFIALFLV